MAHTASEIAQRLGGEVLGDGTLVLQGFAPASAAQAGDLTFAENADYFAAAEASAASVIMVAGDFKSARKTLIKVPNARIAFAQVLPLFSHEPVVQAGIHATAVVAKSARIDPTAQVGPHCVIGENVRIGPRCALHGGNHIGANCQLGDDTQLFPNVVLYPQSQIGCRVRIHAGSVIGSDGFGYVLDAGVHRKVPQIGNVIIGDDVEIGSNTSVDRGALGPTIIGKGTKIDNLVMIGHNVVIGEHCIVISQVGIAGSTKLGQYVTLAGQVGLAGHLKIGDEVIVTAQSGVMNDIPPGEKWFGSPAQPDRQSKRQVLAVQQLPALIRRVNALERKNPDRDGKAD